MRIESSNIIAINIFRGQSESDRFKVGCEGKPLTWQYRLRGLLLWHNFKITEWCQGLSCYWFIAIDSIALAKHLILNLWNLVWLSSNGCTWTISIHFQCHHIHCLWYYPWFVIRVCFYLLFWTSHTDFFAGNSNQEKWCCTKLTPGQVSTWTQSLVPGMAQFSRYKFFLRHRWDIVINYLIWWVHCFVQKI